MYNPNYIEWGPQGWRCPVCGRCYSPTIPMCFYCSNKETTVQSAGTNIDDSKWWEEYLKQSQTGKPVKDNPSTTTATTNIDPNVKVTAWNNTEIGHVKIGKDGSIMWKGPVPEIHYPSNIDLNITSCNECAKDWLKAFNKQFKE